MNKKMFWVALVATTAMALGFTSCSGEDEVEEVVEAPAEAPAPKYNEEVAGFYHGGIYVNFAYMQKYQPEMGQTITITANSNSATATVTYSSATWGEFVYKNVAVTKNSDGSYSLSGTGNCAMASMHTGAVTDYSTTFAGTIANGKLVAQLSIPTVMGGTTILFNPDDIYEVVNNVKIEDIVGSYMGGVYANFPYMQKYLPEAYQTITITANEDNKTVTVRYNSSTWGRFIYGNVAVSKNDEGAYVLTGDGSCAMMSMHSDEVNTYKTTLSATVDDGKLVAELSIPELMQGTTIMFNPDDIDEVLGNASAATE